MEEGPQEQEQEITNTNALMTICVICNEIYAIDDSSEHICAEGTTQQPADQQLAKVVPIDLDDDGVVLGKQRGRKKANRREPKSDEVDDTPSTREDRQKYQCDICGKKFVHLAGLLRHREKIHHIPSSLERSKPRPGKDPPQPFQACFKCMQCGEVFLTITKFNRHLSENELEVSRESVDSHLFPNGDYNVRLVRLVVITTIYQCEFCDKYFSDLLSLFHHESLHDPAQGYECSCCVISVATVEEFIRHNAKTCLYKDQRQSELGAVEKLFVCNVCETSYGTLSELNLHKFNEYHFFPRLCNGTECTNDVGATLQQACDKCGTCFEDAESLVSHRRSAHAASSNNESYQMTQSLECEQSTVPSSRPYLCDQCGKTYTQSSHLLQHIRFHNKVRPFKCTMVDCARSFTIRPDLRDHIRKCHTGERPYHCNECGKRFLTGSVYYQHRLIHRGERRHGCEECGKRFYRADALKNHQRIHSGERPYSCIYCSKTFRQRGDREKHQNTQHLGEQRSRRRPAVKLAVISEQPPAKATPNDLFRNILDDDSGL